MSFVHFAASDEAAGDAVAGRGPNRGRTLGTDSGRRSGRTATAADRVFPRGYSQQISIKQAIQRPISVPRAEVYRSDHLRLARATDASKFRASLDRVRGRALRAERN